MDFEKVKKAFEEYLNNYDRTNKKIGLKINHSYKVAQYMAELAFRLGIEGEEFVLCQIIGLLHDIGRFEQLRIYDSYDDRNVDHADMSVIYLFDEGHIRDFVDTDKYDDIIRDSIKNHNKLKIADDVKEESLKYCKMIRDMDKVDIFYQITIHFDQVFKADEVSPKVLEAFKNERSILKTDVKSKSDGIILTLAFVFDIEFNESYDILVDSDNFDLYLSVVEVDENSEKLWKKLRELCFDKINRGVE